MTAAASVSAIAEAAGLAAATEREQRLQELGEFATPLLEQLASGAPIAADDRVEFAVAEAEVRDSVRARGLRLPEVIEAARSCASAGPRGRAARRPRRRADLDHDERVELGLVVSIRAGPRSGRTG